MQAPGSGRATVGTVLTWLGAAAFPVLLLFEAWTQAPTELFDLVLWSVILVTSLVMVRLLLQRPLVALALGLAGDVAATMTGPHWQLRLAPVVAADLAVVYVVATRSRRAAAAATAMVLGAQLALVVFSPDDTRDPFYTGAFLVLAMATVWAVGSLVRERRQHAEALTAQAAAQAVVAEQLRIARELHDMIAHSIGTIAIQAGVGNRVIDTQPDEARKTLVAIEGTSRETLAGLRRFIGGLRRSDPEPGPGATVVDPAPGLEGLERLVESLADAGVQVDVRRSGEPRPQPLPRDVDLAAFRIVQESVTNVVRHAGTSACRVTVDHGATALSIEVEDDGRGGLVTPGAGYGIVGMRERAELLGGELCAAPRPEGGFRVTARLPLPEGAGR